MKGMGRYDISALDEAQFEPGSRGRVLKNLLGIKSKREMDKVEAREQLRALDELVEIYGPSHRFTSSVIFAKSIGFGLGRSIRGRVDTAA